MIDVEVYSERGGIRISGFSNRIGLKAAVRDIGRELKRYSPSAGDHILKNIDLYVYAAKMKITWADNIHFLTADSVRGLNPNGSKWYLSITELPWVTKRNEVTR